MGSISPVLMWAQASASSSGGFVTLALKRWYAGLTLSHPEAAPTYAGLWMVVAGLAALFAFGVIAQGPKTAFRQFFDIFGLADLVRAALSRLRRAWRVVGVAVGVSVLAWTASQSMHYTDAQGKADMLLLTRSRSVVELAVEHATIVGATPLRDVVGLGDNFALLAIATIVFFQVGTNRWDGSDLVTRLLGDPLGLRAHVCWIMVALYCIYRTIVMPAVGVYALPLGSGGFFPEAGLVPLLAAASDGVMLAWVVVELRNAGLSDMGVERFEPRESLLIWPLAVLTSVLVMPARYVAQLIILAAPYLPSLRPGSTFARVVAHLLGWGLVDLQAASLVVLGLVGTLAWSGGSIRVWLRLWRRLMSQSAARLVAFLALGWVVAGFLTSISYVLILSLPPQAWVLAAADGYGHYITLVTGLWIASGLVELGEQALPVADLAETEVIVVTEILLEGTVIEA